MNKKEKPDQSVSQREKKVKRVKTHHVRTVVPPSGPVNVDCFQMEETESANQKAKEGSILFKDSCNQLKEIFQKIYLAGKSGKTEVDAKMYTSDVCALVMKLKKANRLDKHACKKSKDRVTEGKQKVDNLNLQYQNLLYEVTHLRKEVTKCLEFRSQDEDIELVTVEEFYKDAPPEISKPEVTKHDNHELTLARLQWELEQRKRLALKLKDAEVTKEKCKQQIRKLKECLNNVQPTLLSILESTEPLQSKLGMPLQELHLKHKIAKFLPQPLYILYVEACAYKEALDKKTDVTVEGNVDDAKVLQMKLDSVVDDSGESDQEENSNAKRHRHSVSVHPESSTKDILNKHPLSVVLTIEGDGNKVVIEFHYLFHLKIVTACVRNLTSLKSQSISDNYLLNPNTLLNCLFPEDDGKVSPNPANKYHLQKLECSDNPFSNDKTGWPYIWAQQIAGLHFISPNMCDADETKSNGGIKSSYMESVISSVRYRLTARISLSSDISTLASGSGIPIYITELTNSAHVTSRLRKWCSGSWEEVQNHQDYDSLMEFDVISKDAIVYKAIVERGSAILTALVLIMPDYPTSSPVFLLFLRWKSNLASLTKNAIRELEEEINIHCLEDLNKKHKMISSGHSDMLFLYQVHHLLACFDVFLETDISAGSFEGPREFLREKVFTKVYRARNQSRPFKYLSSKSIFTHR